MFSREELLILFNDVSDEKLKNKMSKIIFVDEEFIERIKERFKNEDLIKIDKSSDSNEYYIHFLSKDEDEDEDDCDYIEESLKLAKEYEKDFDLRPDIHVLEHDSIEDIWTPYDIEAYVRDDVRKYRDNQIKERGV